MLQKKHKPGQDPSLICFDQIGDAASGFITTTQKAANLPFAVKRIFWTYATPPDKSRGGHANKQTLEVMVAVTGTVQVETETVAGKKAHFTLNDPNTGLYIPAYCWLTLKFAPGTLLLCLASSDFDEADYIRDYEHFCNLKPG